MNAEETAHGTLGYADEIAGSLRALQFNGGGDHFAREGHGAEFLPPAFDDVIGHALPALVNDDCIAPQAGELYDSLHDFAARARCWIKDDDGGSFAVGVGRLRGGVVRSSRIGAQGEVMHGFGDDLPTDLLALGEAHAVFTVHLVDATATNAVVRMIL